MKVLVTGATGFVGSHTVAALTRLGHDVRLLVRTPSKVASALAPLGCPVPGDVAQGDVTDAASVRAALDGCDAVVHAAAVYSLDPAREAEIAATNVASTRLVLEAAVEKGLDPVVHVSSFVGLLPGPGVPVGAEVAIGTPEGTYCISKADSERIARDLQAAGHPVVVVWPGMVMGPHDPYLGDSNQILKGWLSGSVTQLARGTMPINDVRDVAEVIARCIERGRGPRRYFAVDGAVSHDRVGPLLAEAVGRPVRTLAFPVPLARFSSRWFGVPPSEEGPYIAGCRFQPDARLTREELGVAFRPVTETLRDTARWLVEARHLPGDRLG